MNYPVKQRKVKTKMCYYEESKENGDSSNPSKPMIEIDDSDINLNKYTPYN